jgi:AcrR family transcriptional regulator
MAATSHADGRVGGLAARYRQADAVEHRLVEAALACIARWGVGKTSLEDIAHEAGVSRATVYRAVPGGKDRLIEVVVGHEAGRFVHEMDVEMAAADDLTDLLSRGITTALAWVSDHPALRTVLEIDPGRVLPHLAFHRLDRFLDVATEVCRPHLARFLPPTAIPAAADWVARLVVTYGLNPTPAVDAHDPESVRRLVRTYLVPALAPAPSHPSPSPEELS